MAQSARDPVVRAAAAIANADAAHAGEFCIRCHAPVGWLAGRSASADFGMLMPGDLDGVSCHFCHRMLDPIARADAPAEDAALLADLDGAGVRPGGTCASSGTPCTSDAACGGAACEFDAGPGRFVVDPLDRRRGPFAVTAPHPTIESSFHRRSAACAPCHDVSIPTYTRQPDGTYALNDLGAAHPTQRPHDMFPEQRTFSEWRASEFATAGVVFPDGRFGGALTAVLPNVVPVVTCQDCHMPDANAPGCSSAAVRPDMPAHGSAGGNTWVLDAVLAEFGAASGLTDARVAAARTRTEAMLGAASDLEIVVQQPVVRVRVTNQTGHKLPTGYPEGRRMWLNVRFFRPDDAAPIAEDGPYDVATGTLDVARTTRIYEARHVVDAAVAGLVGLAPNSVFHLVLNNAVAFDNRIPPRGFTNAAFAAFGGAPVGQAYADGQHWDDTEYAVPPRASRVEATLYFQTTTREYAEFLRDTAPDATGANAFARWDAAGRSAPVAMDRAALDFAPRCAPDTDQCCGLPDGAPCDDADPCTSADACAATGCGGNAPGFDGVRCELGRLERPGPCASPLPKKLQRTLANLVRKAERLLRAAERRVDRGASPARLFTKVAAKLDAIDARAQRAVTRGPAARRITESCAASVVDVTGRARALVGALARVSGRYRVRR
jgi:hypothetical protein